MQDMTRDEEEAAPQTAQPEQPQLVSLNVRFLEFHELLVVLHGAHAPTDAEWEAVVNWALPLKVSQTLFLTAGGMPSTAQWRLLARRMPKLRGAVVSLMPEFMPERPSVPLRIRVFGAGNVEDAYMHLGLTKVAQWDTEQAYSDLIQAIAWSQNQSPEQSPEPMAHGMSPEFSGANLDTHFDDTDVSTEISFQS